MKTLLILLLIFVNIAGAQNTVGAKATFGRFSDNCIAGRGLCSFEIGEDVPAKTGGRLSATTFVLKIPRAGLSEKDQINIAGKAFKDFAKGEVIMFKQPENLQIGSAELFSMKIDKAYNNIAAGLYPVTLTGETVEIVFTLSDVKK